MHVLANIQPFVAPIYSQKYCFTNSSETWLNNQPYITLVSIPARITRTRAVQRRKQCSHSPVGAYLFAFTPPLFPPFFPPNGLNSDYFSRDSVELKFRHSNAIYLSYRNTVYTIQRGKTRRNLCAIPKHTTHAHMRKGSVSSLARVIEGFFRFPNF